MGGYYGSPKTILKNNKDLLGKKNRVSRKDYLGIKYYETKDPIKSTPEQLEAIRLRIQIENKKRKKKQVLFAFLSLVVAILLIYFASKIELVGIQPDF